MARPRKNRVGEYAALLAEELSDQLEKRVALRLAAENAALHVELQTLKEQIERFSAQLEALDARLKPKRRSRPKVGRWVPGGPGRPPKDADERIAAFSQRKKQ
jgi:predicted RNase H-like nuclease (RuvC/YqgF family)